MSGRKTRVEGNFKFIAEILHAARNIYQLSIHLFLNNMTYIIKCNYLDEVVESQGL